MRTLQLQRKWRISYTFYRDAAWPTAILPGFYRGYVMLRFLSVPCFHHKIPLIFHIMHFALLCSSRESRQFSWDITCQLEIAMTLLKRSWKLINCCSEGVQVPTFILSSRWWVFFIRAVTNNGASTALWLSRRNFWSSNTLLCISIPVLCASALGWIVAILSLPRSAFLGRNGFGSWGIGWSSLSKLILMFITDFS